MHYLKNVLRKSQGDKIRVFNGRDGEWIASISAFSKKSGAAQLDERIKDQPLQVRKVHLFFSPIKKQRMDFLIEKAVELGVTDIYPVLMNRTENRKVNESRMFSQIIEAAEQCERLDVPVLHDVMKLPQILGQADIIPLYVALERHDGAKEIAKFDFDGACGFIIGPEGGFDDDERAMILTASGINVISLGDTILRTETAAVACLSYNLLQ